MQQTEFKTIGIIGKYGNTDISHALNQVLTTLEQFDCRLIFDQDTIGTQPFSQDKSFHLVPRKTLAEQSDLLITIGGDGTFLDSGRSVVTADKPIVGVNVGRLGFLTDISPNEVDSKLISVLTGQYLFEARAVLHTSVIRQQKIIAEGIAINDVVIHKSHVSRMIELDVYVDNQFLSSYRADGLIVSTPTGSTAYALSSGGPIMQSSLEAVVIVPVSPHTLTQRPIVIDSNTEQKIVVSDYNSTALQLTLDGQEQTDLQCGDVIKISSHQQKLKILHPQGYENLRRLRKKLGWGNEPNQLVNFRESDD